MGKVVGGLGCYIIIRARKGYLVVNTAGNYGNHGHFKRLATCYTLIRLVREQRIPRSAYLVEAARRITHDPTYRQALVQEQARRVKVHRR